MEHAFHGIKPSLSTARRCQTICANGSLRSLHRLRAGLCARYGRNALELGVYTQLISTQENKPGISLSLSEGAPRAPTREQKSHLHNSHHIEPSTGKKRRRKADEQASEQSQEPCRKRNKEGSERGQQQDSNCHKEGAEEQDPIQCWARTGEWPESFEQMSKSESDGSNKRRRSSTRSYPSRARVGSAPPVHSAAYEEELQRYGIIFDDLTTKDLLTAESKDLCQALLGLDELAPAYNSCSEKMYIEIFQRASKCNEERVRRDLTPHIVPSAELLYLVDGETTLENVREEMSGDWTNQSARRYSAKARLCVRLVIGNFYWRRACQTGKLHEYQQPHQVHGIHVIPVPLVRGKMRKEER